MSGKGRCGERSGGCGEKVAAVHVGAPELTPDLVRAYAPDVLTFFADAQGLRDLPDRHDALFTYAAEEGMSALCTLTWASQYQLILYTRGPVPELTALCEASLSANGADELTFALRQLASP